MRIVITIFLVYTGLLVLYVGLRQNQLINSINSRVTDVTESLINDYPIDHKLTLFSEILREHVIKTSPHYMNNWSRTGTAYEFVTMSPCNPRIQRCG